MVNKKLTNTTLKFVAVYVSFNSLLLANNLFIETKHDSLPRNTEVNRNYAKMKPYFE